MSERASLFQDLAARQERILATIRELRDLDVPEQVLEPIARFATTEMWLEAKE